MSDLVPLTDADVRHVAQLVAGLGGRHPNEVVRDVWAMAARGELALLPVQAAPPAEAAR